MNRKLKILHTVEYYHPSLGGAQEVVKRISEQLVQRGHEVTVATSYLPERCTLKEAGVEIKPFKITGNLVNGMEGEVANYQDFLRKGNFDIMMNYAAQQWTFDAALDVLNEVKSKKVLVPCGFSGLFKSNYRNYFERLPSYLTKYDQLIFLSNNYRDIDFAKQHGISNFSVIPNGCAESEFADPLSDESALELRSRLGIPAHDRIIILVGSHTGVKGHREAIDIYQKANLAKSTLVIVGNTFSRKCASLCQIKATSSSLFRTIGLRKNSVLSLSLDRKQTVDLYKMADLFLFPSNIECSPIVLFEAMASGTPFLATDVGNSRELVEWSQAGVILPTQFSADGYSYAQIKESAAILADLWYDLPLLSSLAQSGRIAWKQRFTWEKIAQDYETLYLRLMESKKI